MVGFVGRDFEFEFSKADRKAAIDFGLGELRKLFGGNTDKHFVKGEFTNRANNPLSLGGYAAARPGRLGARDELKNRRRSVCSSRVKSVPALCRHLRRGVYEWP